VCIYIFISEPEFSTVVSCYGGYIKGWSSWCHKIEFFLISLGMSKREANSANLFKRVAKNNTVV
jgi:hypothetical protein